MRLKSQIWVSAYLRRCSAQAVPGAVMRRGHDEAGAIFIAVDRLDGTAFLYEPAPAGLGETGTGRLWVRCFGGNAVAQAEVDAYMARQLEFDPDLWLIAIEDKAGRHFLEGLLVEAH